MRLIFLFILACCSINLSAQPVSGAELRFRHLTEKDGLSNNGINTIFRDSRGFIWIGTNEGLNVFDGLTFTVFRHSIIDTFSIEGNDIISIAEDPENNIWVSSHCAGLSVLNPFDKRAAPRDYFFHSMNADDICDIRMQPQKMGMWVCNRYTINLWHSDKPGYRQYPVFNLRDNDQVYNIKADGGTVWIGHRTGLMAFDTLSKRMVIHDDWTDSSLCSVIRLHGDSLVLLGTWQNGLFMVDRRTGKKKQLLKDNVVNDIAEVAFGDHRQLWVGSNEGLYTAEIHGSLFNLEDRDFTKFINDKNDPFSLSSNNVTCIMPSGRGLVWVGTTDGLNVFNPSYLQFPAISVKQQSVPMVTSELNFGIAERDNTGNRIYDLCYWHGTGFLQTDSALNVRAHLTLKDDKGQSLIVSSCMRGRDGNLWLSTWNGIWCYDDRRGRLLSSFRKESRGPIHLNNNHAVFVLQDHKGRFWVGTYGSGLNLLDLTADTSYVFMADGKKGSVAANRCDFIFEDAGGSIWIAGPALQEFNESTRKFATYSSRKGDSTSLPGKVNTIVEDSHHNLWLATDGGLTQFDRATGKFHTYTTRDGLPSDECSALLLDSSGVLWTTTAGGLASIDIPTGTVTSFTTNDGLPTNQLGNVLLPAGKGKILISLQSSDSPLLAFSTGRQKENQDIPLHFTGISILGLEQRYPKPVDSLAALRLSYRQNVFSISFRALDYTNPGDIRYQCKLVGFDRNWVDLGHRNYVTYTNLDGGSYEFTVKATDAKGRWLNKELLLRVVITPPFWKTWWFYAATFLFLVIAVYILFRVRVNTIRKEGEKKAKMAAEIADLEMKALKAQMNPHFIFNALSSIQESILNGRTDAASRYLGKFSRLIRTVLEFSDRKLITLEQEIDYLTLYLELESFRFEDFQFKITVTENTDNEFIRIPPMLVQPFVENAIKHGLSHKNGEKKLTICFEEDGSGYLKVNVIDNGIGREESTLLNAGRNLSRQSLGIKITSRRLQLLNGGEGEVMHIRDHRASEGETETGTEVTLLIPIETVV